MLVEALVPGVKLDDNQMWISTLWEDFGLESRESNQFNKKTTWDNARNSEMNQAIGSPSIRFQVFWALRKIGNSLIHLFVSGGDAAKFWSIWPIKPSKALKTPVLKTFDIPVFSASTVGSYAPTVPPPKLARGNWNP
ncbi:hypothetical protein BDR26DRAFT_895794 [Obelidium mucronatum]|nr:hypothetical protein BDR26DRAFT_895794 [Obelidium mucronatum]